MKWQSRKSNSLIITLLFCVIFQVGCRVDSDYKLIPSLNISRKDINSDVTIYAPFGWNSNLIGEPVSIMVENNGKDPIVFSNDYGIEVFLQEENNWQELDLVKTKYIEGDVYLRSAENNPLYFGSTMVDPILEDQSHQVKIRIVIIGHRYINEKITDQLVAAYTDIWLFPKE